MSGYDPSANGNGHAQPDPELARGGGELRRALSSDTRKRATLRMVNQALRKGWIKPWNVMGEDYSDIPQLVSEVVRDAAREGKTMTVLTGAEVLRRFASDNVRLVEVLDKAKRVQEPGVQNNTININVQIPSRDRVDAA